MNIRKSYIRKSIYKRQKRIQINVTSLMNNSAIVALSSVTCLIIGSLIIQELVNMKSLRTQAQIVIQPGNLEQALEKIRKD